MCSEKVFIFILMSNVDFRSSQSNLYKPESSTPRSRSALLRLAAGLVRSSNFHVPHPELLFTLVPFTTGAGLCRTSTRALAPCSWVCALGLPREGPRLAAAPLQKLIKPFYPLKMGALCSPPQIQADFSQVASRCHVMLKSANNL